MKKKVIIFILFSIFFGNQRLLLLYPDADLSNTGKLNVSDVNAIHLLFTDGFNTYSDFDLVVPSDNAICYSSECATALAVEYNADQVVTSKIRVLGSKIIFTGMIQNIDSSDEFTTRITALNVEDMENASYRLAKSLINRDSIEDAVDIDNIIESEEEEATRRKSLSRVGFAVGFLAPINGDRYYYYDNNQNYKKCSFLNLGYVQNWELKSNNSILMDAFVNFGLGPGMDSQNPAMIFGVDLTYNYFKNKTDNSMFYGYGLGWHFGPESKDIIPYEDGSWSVDQEFTNRAALIGQVGYVFMRTYDMNVMLRAKYHLEITDWSSEFDNGITFNVTIVNKKRKLTNLQRNQTNNNNIEYRFPLLELLYRILEN